MQVLDQSGQVQGQKSVAVMVEDEDAYYVDPTLRPSLRTSAAAGGHGRTVAFVVDRGGVEVVVKCHDSEPKVRQSPLEVMRVLR